MKNRSTYGFSYRASMIMLAMSLLCMGKTALGQEGPIAPVADVFKVMELASGSKMDTLWPEFKVLEIPVLVFDSLNTYLFHSCTAAEGFVRSGKDPEVWVYKGQHPLVRGNSIVRMGDNWTATSVLSPFSRRTGEKYDLKDMAGNENGNLRIMNHPCITWFNDMVRITRLVINGLKQAPEIIEDEKKLIIKENGLSIEINYSELNIDKDLYIVDL